MRAKLCRRFQMQRDLEWLNVVLVPGSVSLALTQFGFPLGPGTLLAMGALAGNLVIGGLWWHAKLKQVLDRAPFPRVTFRRLRLVALALLALPLPFILLDRSTANIAFGLWVFALLEYINYFHVQLMHDTRADWRRLLRDRRLRPSGLARDLRGE